MKGTDLRIASIGFGRYFRDTYLPVLKQRGIPLVAAYIDHCVRTNPRLHQPRARQNFEKAIDILNAEGIKIRDIKDFPPKKDDVHGVIISAFHTAHFDAAEKALGVGIPILLDKPPVSVPYCSSRPGAAKRLLPQMARLANLATENEVLFIVAVQRRYEKTYEWLKRRLSSVTHDVAPRHVALLNISDRPRTAGNMTWTVRPQPSGGGKLMQTGYHHVDVLLWLWQDRIASVDVMAQLSRYQFTGEEIGETGSTPSRSNVEKGADIALKLRLSGEPRQIITANLSLRCAGPLHCVKEELRVSLEGRATDPEKRETVCLDRTRFGKRNIGRPAVVSRHTNKGRIPVRISGARGGNDLPLHDFLNCIENNRTKSEVSPGEDQVLTIGVIQAAYLSGITGATQRFQCSKAPGDPHNAIFTPTLQKTVGRIA